MFNPYSSMHFIKMGKYSLYFTSISALYNFFFSRGEDGKRREARKPIYHGGGLMEEFLPPKPTAAAFHWH